MFFCFTSLFEPEGFHLSNRFFGISIPLHLQGHHSHWVLQDLNLWPLPCKIRGPIPAPFSTIPAVKIQQLVRSQIPWIGPAEYP
jgi:hypothetical protein